jgi:hypothetical protein
MVAHRTVYSRQSTRGTEHLARRISVTVRDRRLGDAVDHVFARGDRFTRPAGADRSARERDQRSPKKDREWTRCVNSLRRGTRRQRETAMQHDAEIGHGRHAESGENQLPMIDRRTMLKLGLTATAAAGVGVTGLIGRGPLRTPSAHASEGSVQVTKRFYLSKPSHDLFRHKRLHSSSQLMQGFTFDNVNRRLFIAAQASTKAPTDLYINRVKFDGTIDGYMHLPNAGHGVSIGVEPVGSDSYIWMECDADGTSNDSRGTALARFKFVNGAAPSGVKKFFTGSKGITCATDPIHNRIMVRRTENGVKHYRLYDLPTSGGTYFSREWVQFDEPDGWGSGERTFQGYAICGSWLYVIDGDRNKANSTVHAINLNTGKDEYHHATTAGSTIPNREPEGLAVYQPIGHGPRLFLGFSSIDSGGHYANLFYKDVMGWN